MDNKQVIWDLRPTETTEMTENERRGGRGKERIVTGARMLPADRSFPGRERQEGEAKNLISSVEFRDKGVRGRSARRRDSFSLATTREGAALLPHGRWEYRASIQYSPENCPQNCPELLRHV